MRSSVAVRQVHGTRILEAARPRPGFQVRGEADGLMTSKKHQEARLARSAARLAAVQIAEKMKDGDAARTREALDKVLGGLEDQALRQRAQKVRDSL